MECVLNSPEGRARPAEGVSVHAAILNQGKGAWAFSELAEQLSAALWLPVVEEPAEINYVLFWEGQETPPESFIPGEAVDIAGDKRSQAQLFEEAGVPAPLTVEFASFDEATAHVVDHADEQWVLKYPIGCGAAGHRILDAGMTPPDNWPTPYILQEFIEMEEPEVYRLYCAGGSVFGWNVRRFPPDATKRSPWVAHATGARYSLLGTAPAEAVEVATAALRATKLFAAFGCVDLLPSPRGWLALEVGTDGLNNYVDRDVPEPLRTELDRHIADAFWARIGEPPWPPGAWVPRAM